MGCLSPIVGKEPCNERHKEIQHGHLDAQSRPAVAIYPETKYRRRASREYSGEAPIAESLCTSRGWNRRSHVRAGRREQCRPNDAMHEHEPEHDVVFVDD